MGLGPNSTILLYLLKKSFICGLEFGFLLLEDLNTCREAKLLTPKMPKSVAM